MRFAPTLAAIIFAAPILLQAQSDSLHAGERVRVRVGASSRNTSAYIGNLSALSRDSLILGIPGGKGSVVLLRPAITEVAISDGHQSRWSQLPYALPLAISTLTIAALPTVHGSVGAHLNTERYLLLGTNALLIGRVLLRPLPERWRPLNSWLEQAP